MAIKKKEEETALKQERVQILWDFFRIFDESIKARETVEDISGHNKYVRIVKPVTNGFLTRLKNTRSIIDVVSYLALPGMIALKPKQFLKVLVYKEFID
jgi:hypothetical protein